jgi:beta-glucosidase
MNATWLGAVPNNMWPGTDRGKGFLEADYTENLLFGYRWYDSTPSATALWHFGHGLSYTRFNYTRLAVAGAVSPTSSAVVSVEVANIGDREGEEVVQLYVGFPSAAAEPPKLLKGFEKLRLGAGDATTAFFPLDAEALSVWDVTAQAWRLVRGTYTIYAAASSRDIRLTATMTV